jgi:hypothetical protein
MHLPPVLSQQARNLRATSAFLDAIAQSSPDNFAGAINLARIGAAHQAEAMGIDLAGASYLGIHHDAPSAALLDLAQRHSATPTPEGEARLRELDALPEASREALTRFVDAFLALDQATRAAYAHADPALLASLQTSGEAEVSSWNVLGTAGVDLAPILRTRNAFLDTLGPLRDIPLPQDRTALCNPVVVAPAFTLELSGCDATYTLDVVLSLDLGGIDTYNNNAGGNGISPPFSCWIPGQNPAAALVDLGYGDDYYGNPSDARFCGANGGAMGGVGFLLDEGGNDTYIAASWGTNGGGNGGVGFLLDAEGRDKYTAGWYGTNGGSVEGMGFLLEMDGIDTYTAGGLGTNGGGALGQGLLLDAGGTGDAYSDMEESCNGSGIDWTLVPKCIAGEQIDAAGERLASGSCFRLGSIFPSWGNAIPPQPEKGLTPARPARSPRCLRPGTASPRRGGRRCA